MKRDRNYDYLVKLLIIGNSGVGKTNLLMRFAEDNFTLSHLTTIGIDFKTKTLKIGGVKAKLQIWDTAGQERFKTITQTYYRGAMGIILAYSVDDRDSFEDIQSWVKQIKMHAGSDVVKVLVGNKCDTEKRKITTNEGQELARQLNMDFYETSAKEGTNVEDCIVKTATSIVLRLEQQSKVNIGKDTPSARMSLNGQKIKNQNEKKKNCCLML